MVNIRFAVAVIAALALISCSKKEPVKTAEQVKIEQDQAAKATRDNPVWGAQVKALDKAKDTAAAAAEATKKVDDALKKAE